MLHEGSEHIFFRKDFNQFEKMTLVLYILRHFNGDFSVAVVNNTLELFLAKGNICRHIFLDNFGNAELHINILEDGDEVHEEDVVVIEVAVDIGADFWYLFYLVFAFLADLFEGTVGISDLLFGRDVLDRFHEDEISASDDLEDAHVQFNFLKVLGHVLNLLEDFQLGGEWIAVLEGEVFEVDEHLLDGDIVIAA